MRTTSIQCYFDVLGNGYDPTVLTHALGIEPTKTWRIGDRTRKSGRPYKQDGWSLRSDEVASLDLQEVVLPILTRMYPVASILVDSCARLQLEPILACAVYVKDGHMPAITLDTKTVRMLGTLGAALDIDVIDLGPSDEGGSPEGEWLTGPFQIAP